MTVVELPPAAHAEYSPSSSEGWAICADYINANRGCADVTSWEAAEGVAAHWIRNECLTQGEDASNFIGHVQKVGTWEFEWADDDARLLQPGINWLRSHTGTLYGEHWVDLTEWLGRDSQGRRQGGTLDVGIICEDGLVIVDDEKWGRGIAVTAERCKQEMLYGLGFAAEQGITDPDTRFLLSIDQPRHIAGGGRWETTLRELLEFGEWIKTRVAATKAPNPPRTASPKGCQWCRRKQAPGGCPTLDAYIIDLLGQEFDDLDFPPIALPQGLTPDRRRVVIDHAKMISDWLDTMYRQCLGDALAGLPTGGLKAIEGRKDADRFHDTKAATPVVEGILGDRSFTKSLISPTEARKRITDDFDLLLVEPLIKRGQKKPMLVPISHEKPAIVSAEEFDELED